MRRYEFTAKIGKEVLHPKGFYYQKKHVILVGDVDRDHTIRRKELISDVEITVTEVTDKCVHEK